MNVYPQNGTNGSSARSTEHYRVSVSDFSACMVLLNGDCFEASFYLRLSSAYGYGRETLGERLNDSNNLFLACKVDDEVQLLQLASIAYIQVRGSLPEAEYREHVGASRQRATLTLKTGETLAGEFLSILPPSRSRVSDLLNSPEERFLLFFTEGSSLYVNRDAIVRVCP
jgi:hypothetical protein